MKKTNISALASILVVSMAVGYVMLWPKTLYEFFISTLYGLIFVGSSYIVAIGEKK